MHLQFASHTQRASSPPHSHPVHFVSCFFLVNTICVVLSLPALPLEFVASVSNHALDTLDFAQA